MKQSSFTALFTDPGSIHTGYVIVSIDMDASSFFILEAGEVSGFKASAELISYSVRDFGVSLWVYEGFRLYAHKADAKVNDELEEVQTIGAMRLAASYQPLTLLKQYAYEIKIPPFEDTRIKSMGLDYRQHMPSNHTRDAFRHFLKYWCFTLKKGMPKIIGLRGVVSSARFIS